MQQIGRLGGGGFGSNTTTSAAWGTDGTSYGGGIGGAVGSKEGNGRWTISYLCK